MPELPEVETVRRMIEPLLAGRKMLSVTIKNPQIIARPEASVFAACLTGQTAKHMSRRGKFLTIHFESGDRVVLHLRMTGSLLVTTADYPLDKHTHLIAELSDGNQMRYVDMRRFGRFWYLKAGEEDSFTGQSRLGPEPFDEVLTAQYLCAKLSRRKKTIKEMLLDQSVVAGIGNIYSDEILYRAGIFPGEKCTDLHKEDWDALAAAIREIMKWGVAVNQMTAEEYLAGKGLDYHNIPGLKAYGQGGMACARCGSIMKRTVIAGRSSCYCPACQKKKQG